MVGGCIVQSRMCVIWCIGTPLKGYRLRWRFGGVQEGVSGSGCWHGVDVQKYQRSQATTSTFKRGCLEISSIRVIYDGAAITGGDAEVDSVEAMNMEDD